MYLMINRKIAIFKLLIILVIFSPYLSSWLPPIGNLPIGPILRQIMFGLVLVATILFSGSQKDLEIKSLFRIYLLIVTLTLVSFIYGPSSLIQYAAGVASFVFYPAIFIFSLILFDRTKLCKIKSLLLAFDKFFVIFFISAASIGVLDVALDGLLVKFFGFNPNYGGGDFSLITSYNGVTRANAGISDALAFGYLMSIAIIYFFHRAARKPTFTNTVGLALCTLACMLTLTRGAIISAFITYLIYMLTLRRVVMLLLVLPVVGYVTYISPYSDLFLGRFTDSDTGSEASSLLRLVMALNSIEFLSKNPMGIGIGTQGAGNVLSVIDNRLNTDNYFFHIFLELGLLIGPFFIFFLYRQFSYAFSLIRSKRFVASYLILFLVSAALSSSIAFATLAVFYWFILYLIVLESRLSHEN